MGRRSSSYDAVIVGGGHNGLVAAAYLARAGLSCLLLERRNELGGAAVSERVFAGLDARLSRYAYLVSLLPRQIVEELGLGLQLARRRTASYTPDPRHGFSRGLLLGGPQPGPGSEAGTSAEDAEAVAGLRAFHELTTGVARALFPTMLEPLRGRDEIRARVGEESWELLFERPLGEGVCGRLDHDLLAGVALTDALIGTFASAGEESLLQNRCFLYHVIGRCSGEWLVPVGGMGRLSAELTAAAREAGAELQAGAEVEAVVPEGREIEIRYAHEGVRCDARARWVLVNAAPAVLDRLVEADPPVPPVEGSQLKVNMLLSRLPRLKDGRVDPHDAFAGTFHVNEGAAQLQAAFEQAAAGAIPEPAPCEAYCHSLTDPGILGDDLRARGVHTLTVFGLHMPARLFTSDPGGARERALRAVLSSLDDVLAEPIEDCVLSGRDGSPCIEACTPVDLERELAMPGGHIFHRPLQWPFAERPEEVGTWGVETAHERILLCGAGARRGGGVSGIPGRNAAMAVLAADRGPRLTAT
jgi:phytoene dehydrogenase-like protein